MDLGRVITTGLETWFRNLLPLAGLGLLVCAPAMLVHVLRDAYMREIVAIDLDVVYPVLLTGTTALSLILHNILAAAVVVWLSPQSRDQHPSIWRCLSTVLSRFYAVLGVSLAGVLSALAMLACLAPGFILACMWFVAMPVVIVERIGVRAALARSQALTKGNRWLIFVLFLILMAIGFLASGFCQPIIGLVTPTNRVGIIGASLFRQCITLCAGLLWAVMITVTYQELRSLKEETGVTEIAAE